MEDAKPSWREVDVVDDILFLAVGLRHAAVRDAEPIRVTRAVTSWLAYAAEPDTVAPWVVLRAELPDHVPAVLKVRALTRLRTRTLVVMHERHPAHEARLYEAGAYAVLDRTDDFARLPTLLMEREGAHGSPDPPPRALSDRQLQIACLFGARSAPSTAVLAQLLRLPHTSVRTHLRRARQSLAAAGYDVSNRSRLRSALIDDGWLTPTL